MAPCLGPSGGGWGRLLRVACRSRPDRSAPCAVKKHTRLPGARAWLLTDTPAPAAAHSNTALIPQQALGTLVYWRPGTVYCAAWSCGGQTAGGMDSLFSTSPQVGCVGSSCFAAVRAAVWAAVLACLHNQIHTLHPVCSLRAAPGPYGWAYPVLSIAGAGVEVVCCE